MRYLGYKVFVLSQLVVGIIIMMKFVKREVA